MKYHNGNSKGQFPVRLQTKNGGSGSERRAEEDGMLTCPDSLFYFIF